MANIPHPETLVSRLVAVERAVRELAKRGGLGNAVITRGGLEVQYDNGVPALRIGEFQYGDETVFGISTRRRDGSLAMWQYSSPSGGGYWSLWDRAGNIIMSDDAGSGQGVATPWITVPFYDDANPTQTTTSATFVSLQNAWYAKQHPKLLARIRVRSSAGDTTGEVRVVVNGVQIGDVRTVAASENAYWDFGALAVDGDHQEFLDVQVQARRTAGTGTIGVRVLAAYASQT